MDDPLCRPDFTLSHELSLWLTRVSTDRMNNDDVLALTDEVTAAFGQGPAVYEVVDTPKHPSDIAATLAVEWRSGAFLPQTERETAQVAALEALRRAAGDFDEDHKASCEYRVAVVETSGVGVPLYDSTISLEVPENEFSFSD